VNSLTTIALYFLSSALGLTLSMAVGAWAGWAEPFWIFEKGGAMFTSGLLVLAVGAWPMSGIHQILMKRSFSGRDSSPRAIAVSGFGAGVLLMPAFFAIASLYYWLPISKDFQPIILLAVLAAPIGAAISALLASRFPR
jgi:hypothetical protein